MARKGLHYVHCPDAISEGEWVEDSSENAHRVHPSRMTQDMEELLEDAYTQYTDGYTCPGPIDVDVPDGHGGKRRLRILYDFEHQYAVVTKNAGDDTHPFSVRFWNRLPKKYIFAVAREVSRMREQDLEWFYRDPDYRDETEEWWQWFAKDVDFKQYMDEYRRLYPDDSLVFRDMYEWDPEDYWMLA